MRIQTLLLTVILAAAISFIAGCQSRPVASPTPGHPPKTVSLTPANALPAFKVDMEHNASDEGAAGFKFRGVPAPSKGDAASQAKVILVDGQRDSNGGDVSKLTDDRVPKGSDQPGDNFFFAQ